LNGEQIKFDNYAVRSIKDADRKINVRHQVTIAESFCGCELKEPTPSYHFFARMYDEYMSHVEYDKWVNFILSHYNKERKQRPDRILELACGTANVAAKLAHKGLVVEASDNSPEMLDIADVKKIKPELYLADMTAPLKANNYDLILLLFDSINYLEDDNQMKELMIQAANGLKDGGIFIFDISTINNCRENFDGFVNIEDHDDFYFVHASELSESQMFQTSQLLFFKEMPNGLVREEESHIQTILPVQAFKEFIGYSGLELTGIYSMETENNLLKINSATLDDKFGRLFFVCRKK
jgi:SAM-dependent methyltransferase